VSTTTHGNRAWREYGTSCKATSARALLRSRCAVPRLTTRSHDDANLRPKVSREAEIGLVTSRVVRPSFTERLKDNDAAHRVVSKVIHYTTVVTTQCF